MITVRGLQVNYKWHQEPVLKGVDATLDGKSLVLGPNGSGKTTLFRSICGLTNLSSGEILIDGENMQDIYAKTSINLALLSLAAWLIALAILDVLLLKKTRGISTEELRAV